MRYWARTTHNFNNETREWEFREELRKDYIQYSSMCHDPFRTPLGIHALDSGHWHSLHEIIWRNIEYQKQYYKQNQEKFKEYYKNNQDKTKEY